MRSGMASASSSISGQGSAATTMTCAPAAAMSSAFQTAGGVPPATSTRRPPSLKKIGSVARGSILPGGLGARRRCPTSRGAYHWRRMMRGSRIRKVTVPPGAPSTTLRVPPRFAREYGERRAIPPPHRGGGDRAKPGGGADRVQWAVATPVVDSASHADRVPVNNPPPTPPDRDRRRRRRACSPWAAARDRGWRGRCRRPSRPKTSVVMPAAWPQGALSLNA